MDVQKHRMLDPYDFGPLKRPQIMICILYLRILYFVRSFYTCVKFLYTCVLNLWTQLKKRIKTYVLSFKQV